VEVERLKKNSRLGFHHKPERLVEDTAAQRKKRGGNANIVMTEICAGGGLNSRKRLGQTPISKWKKKRNSQKMGAVRDPAERVQRIRARGNGESTERVLVGGESGGGRVVGQNFLLGKKVRRFVDSP